MTRLVIVGVGSNIKPKENVSRAVQWLNQYFSPIQESNWVTTAPIGIKDQPDYLNGALAFHSPLSKEEIKSILKKGEKELGRDFNAPSYGPRVIDLDLVVWGSQILDQDFYTRDFLKKAVLELHPQLNY